MATNTSADNMEYVEIPAKDLFDKDFEGIWNNTTHYGPGVHLVEKNVADHLKDRLKVWREEQIRTLRPNSDRRVNSGL